MDSKRVLTTLVALDNWFESLRVPLGIGGPVAHWWESSLIYCGPMIDWRYEGLLSGYVELYRKTGDQHWLNRALIAGNEVCAAQLPNGSFWNSSFQIGPIEGGTPHEAGVDAGLLELAYLLRDLSDPRWQTYYQAAERNLREFQLGRLWSEEKHAFRDQPWNTTFVPNKNGTTLEALLLYESLGGESMEKYVRGAAELMLSAQVWEKVPYYGATIHLGTGRHRLTIGIYTARNVGALMRLYQRYPEQRFLDAAVAMSKFLVSLIQEDGTAFGYYPDGRLIRCPSWVSPSGDFLRAFTVLLPFIPELTSLSDQLAERLIGQQLPSGGIPTSHGLGNKGATKLPSAKPDFRDVLPVAGWCDKAFRGLALYFSPQAEQQDFAPAESAITEVACTWKHIHCCYRETKDEIALIEEAGRQPLYQWHKHEPYPTIYRL